MRSLLLMMSALLVLSGAGLSAPRPPGTSWKIVHNGPQDMCTAIAREDDELQYGLSAEGRDFLLHIWAPDFPKENRSYEATLAFKGAASGPVAALGRDGLMSISLGRGELAVGLTKATEATITVEGHAHSVSLEGGAAALDQVARCASQPTLAEAPQKPPLPISGAGGWTLYETTPYDSGKACMAQLNGPEVDTILQYDEKNILELVGGNAIWAFPPQDVPMKISIDSGPDLPVSQPAHLEGHTFTLKVNDPQMVEQLRHARMIDWVFPKGSLRSSVTGLGTALDAVRKCRAGTQS